ncbi:hypothetical protein [Streptomyces virginiae]|uniref:hypothetical protein n=1 Tax=Streptomyces virginiae TaxID=1961 RepID=UPI0022588DD7|nr:hypothetical protein [Streptomyces virginiae]MCX5278417.1 hypothetical protein [Streptomyces virginiae]
MILAAKVAGTVLAAAVGTGAAVTALPEKSPAPGYIHYEGATVDLTPKAGTGGLLLRTEDGTVVGAMGTDDEASIQGCHPTNPGLVWVRQITTGTHSGGWGASAGYVRHAYADVDGTLPCGG